MEFTGKDLALIAEAVQNYKEAYISEQDRINFINTPSLKSILLAPLVAKIEELNHLSERISEAVLRN